jgi:hypothetical protein
VKGTANRIFKDMNEANFLTPQLMLRSERRATSACSRK